MDSPLERARLYAKEISNQGIKVVAFDMDQTAVAKHSRGRLERGSDLVDFLSHVTPAFKSLVPALHEAQVKCAVATHSDAAQYSPQKPRDCFIIGDDLVEALLDSCFSRDDGPDLDAIFVVAYNPKYRGAEGLKDENLFKRHHMRKISNHFGVDPKEILLFDDDPSVCEDTAQYIGRVVQVPEATGLTFHVLEAALGGVNDDRKRF